MHSDWKLIEGVYRRALVPNTIAILGSTVNVFFDGILVGQRMGEVGITAINQSMPIYLLLCMIGSLIASGSSTLSAAAMGDNRQEEGKGYYSLGVEMAVLCGVIFCVVGLALTGPLSHALGSDETQGMVETYVRITFLCGIFKALMYLPSFFLRLEGRTKESAACTITMAVLNILLDYLFLFCLDAGIRGAAWASNLATAAACVMAFFFCSRKGADFRFHPVRPKKGQILSVIKTGSPMALNNFFSSVRLLCLNAIMNAAGGSSLVAAFAITNDLNEFSISIQNGVPQAGSAMLGIYFGEKDTRSVKKLLRMELRTGALCAAAFGAVLILTGGKIGLLFGSSQNLRFPVTCLAAEIFLGTINSVLIYYYSATMRPLLADILTVLRVFAAAVPSAALLIGCGRGIWFFYWIAELVTAAVCGVVALQHKSIYLLDESDVTEGRSVNFTVTCDTTDICEASDKIGEFCTENGFDADQTMTISLAVEELLTITAEKSMEGKGTMDLRLLKLPDSGILRIRSAGRRYNPLEEEEAGDPLEYLGVSLIKKMAQRTEYQSTLGLNTLIVYI